MSNDPAREFEDALLVAKVAARMKESPMEIIPRSECDEVNKLLVQVHYIVQEWVIRANHSQDRWEEYEEVSQAKVKEITKFRDDLDKLIDKVGPSGGSNHLRSNMGSASRVGPAKITKLDQLSRTEPTPIGPNTEIRIPGFYAEWDGNGRSAKAPGARWTLRQEGTDARVRDLIIKG